MFLGEAPRIQFERAKRSDPWARLGPALIVSALLAIVVVVCVLLGYAFGKTVLGA